MGFVKPDSVSAVMDENGDVDVPIWSSENGGPVYKYGLDGQARIARHAVEALKTFPVAVTTSYTLRNDDVVGFGLLEPDRDRRSAWFAYRDAIGSHRQ